MVRINRSGEGGTGASDMAVVVEGKGGGALELEVGNDANKRERNEKSKCGVRLREASERTQGSLGDAA